ncbi:MAG: O-antigen ligase family protein [Negativicutes bacterium]|nr:O-antigen ligase family protein [Negativicutes bacterium]
MTLSYLTRRNIFYALDYWLQHCLLAVAFFLPLSLNITSLFLGIGAILWAGKMAAAGRLGFVRTPFDIAVALLVAISGASVFAAPERWLSFYNYYHLMGRYILLYYLVINNIADRETLRRMIKAVLLSALLVTGYGFYQYIHGMDISAFEWVDGEQFPDLKMRVFSTLENPNLLAGFLVMMIAVAAGMGLGTAGWREKALLFGLVLALGACLVLTYSRGAWISVLAVIAVYGVYYNRRIFWLMAIVPLALFCAHSAVIERVASILNPTDTSSTLRLALWESTLAMIMDKPLQGIGWGAYLRVYPAYDFFVQDAGTVIYHAHNMYLHLAAEIGVPGLMVFLLLMFGHVRMALSARRLAAERWLRGLMLGIAAAIYGLAVSGITDYIMFNIQMAMLFWLLNALVVVGWRVATRSRT